LRDPGPDLFDPGPAAGSAGLVSQVLGLAPVAAGHRQQRSLEQRGHEDLVGVGLPADQRIRVG
jgi:hypothetical protein